jgi:hypothetical protein
MAGRESLFGSDVIIVHRLLKNEIVPKLGIGAYAALTRAFMTSTSLDPASIGMRAHSETYDHIGEIELWVDDLEARWQVEDSSKRVFVGKDEALLSMETEVPAPPEVVWQFVTLPGRRLVWQAPGGITAVEQDNPGGRRGVGTVNHCMHGKDAVIEEILDWRPFDYFSDRSVMPGGINFLSTTEFVPTPNGTTLRMNFAPPEDPAHREFFVQMGPVWEAGLKAGLEILKVDAKADAEHILRDRHEPELPRPKNADGFLEARLLEEIKPIQYVG